ncbi:MAG: hypothetical protein JO250_11745 [Armatimonadetes bacterium]|nr:hypothetical protein [Armatimonadota bacterium]
MPAFPFRRLLPCLALACLPLLPALGQRPGDGPPALNVYTESPWRQLPLKEVNSRTVVDGPLAQTRITYLIENKMAERNEVGLNLHVPPGAVLHAFGYFYQGRFIRGRMYDNDEAWRIYQAVTSRGRDPGIMDRPGAQDYHVQVYPVEARHDLRLIIELSQLLPTDESGAHFELPLTQVSEINRPVEVQSEVIVRNHPAREVTDNLGAASSTRGGNAVLRLRSRAKPTRNWRVTIRRRSAGPARSVYSALSGNRGGYYAVTVTAPYPLVRPRVALSSSPGTDLTLPTRFGTIPACHNLSFAGTYRRPEAVRVTVASAGHAPLRFRVHLGARSVPEAENPAGTVWADKRIAALQDGGRPQERAEVVRLSKEFTVVSRFTALLAIPREELDYYKKVLARRNVSTNTRYTGGGGGDPYIAVKAPADARQVVAVFPNCDVKDLTYDTPRHVWDGRFDIPLGTPAGDYRVTVIVVHRDGTRSRFVLVYQNLLSGPQVKDLTALHAAPGATVPVRVSGTGIARAVAVAPWGERVELGLDGGDWGAALHVPASWPSGASQVTLVLLDGAHNRTEVTLDLDVE